MPKTQVPSNILSEVRSLTKNELKALRILIDDLIVDKPEAVAILNYFNKVSGKQYKPVACNLLAIKGRLAEGYSPEDLMRVADTMTGMWKGKKEEYFLRPETVYGATKFQTYVNLKTKSKSEERQRKTLW